MKNVITNSSPACCFRALQNRTGGAPRRLKASHLPPGHRTETLLPRRLLLPVRIRDPALRYTAIIFAPPAYFAVRARIRCTRTCFCRNFALWVGHPFLGPGRRRDLPLALVKIERRIQFSLAAQQFLEPRLVLEGLARLLPEIPQHLFSAGSPLPFVHRCLVQAAQRILDALHGSDRILRIQLRLVDARSPDEQRCR